MVCSPRVMQFQKQQLDKSKMLSTDCNTSFRMILTITDEGFTLYEQKQPLIKQQDLHLPQQLGKQDLW